MTGTGGWSQAVVAGNRAVLEAEDLQTVEVRIRLVEIRLSQTHCNPKIQDRIRFSNFDRIFVLKRAHRTTLNGFEIKPL